MSWRTKGRMVVLPPQAADMEPERKSLAERAPVSGDGWSRCTWLSMPPGRTSLPEASSSSSPRSRASPSATMRPPRMPMSAGKRSAAVTTVPPRMTRSKRLMFGVLHCRAGSTGLAGGWYSWSGMEIRASAIGMGSQWRAAFHPLDEPHQTSLDASAHDSPAFSTSNRVSIADHRSRSTMRMYSWNDTPLPTSSRRPLLRSSSASCIVRVMRISSVMP